MESLSSRCVEEANSTDCLLRAIISFLEEQQKENDAKFEWDPITFGFTVTIALVAAGFALITIVQAVLAAGPGRRKSNSEAIGKWSAHTKRKWQFWDLGYLHVAKTPILTVENVLEYLESVDQKNERLSDDSPKRDPGHSGQISGSLAANAAKWLVFLDEVRLSHLELADAALETWLADYLPGDLLAVPALIEVQFAYIFTILFCQPLRTIGMDKQHPGLVAKNVQFEVRQHPTLGPIATFSRYHQNSKKASRNIITPKMLSIVEKQARGIVHVSTTPISMECDARCNEPMRRRELYHLEKAGVIDHVDVSSQTVLSGLALRGHWSSCECTGVAYKHQRRGIGLISPFPSTTTLFALTFASIPNAIPEIFPRRKLDLRGLFGALSISTGIAIERRVEPIEDGFEHEYHLLGLMFPSSRYSATTCLCRRIVNACCKMLENIDIEGEEILSIAAEDLLQFRKDAKGMLFVVESWLLRRCLQRELRCAKFSLFNDTAKLQLISKFLRSNKPLTKGLSLPKFLELYRGYVDSEMGHESMRTFEGDGKPSRKEFRQVLDALAKLTGLGGYLIDNVKDDASLGGLIPINIVWPEEACKSPDLTLDLKYFKLADQEIDIDLETELRRPIDGDIIQPNAGLVRQVLGWRMLFLTILYITAFDNSDMLDSGSWNQILPML
ncbi:uncharacterized protein FIESC28_07142 [Fusarium coffeatum]|uniref:Uncharacterized protein n=1 Tax=Fusarium coffeatum TaxID=231269 RepID=A0A366RHU1_9HYPO|nr:uncharacterized protein FIESC28_07142 [Fusarium coffeatum]RBR15940.1 hypothetical protein FIESC28_07142 [Fusarium coffeatum]